MTKGCYENVTAFYILKQEVQWHLLVLLSLPETAGSRKQKGTGPYVP
jgi:hypothetical protein